MSQHLEKKGSDLIEFLERWKKLGVLLSGVLYTLISSILFLADVTISEEFLFSVVMTLIGIILAAASLVGIVRQRNDVGVLLPQGVTRKVPKPHTRPLAARMLAILGLIVLATTTILWIWFGIFPQFKNNQFSKNATRFPFGESLALKVSIKPETFWWECTVAVIEDGSIDTTTITPTITSSRTTLPGQFSQQPSPQLAMVNFPGIIRVTITRKPLEEPVQVSAKVPVRVLSYTPIQDTTNLAIIPTGGGPGYNFWLFEADISAQSTFNVNQLIWAGYSPELTTKLKQLGDTAIFDPIPNEIRRAIEDDTILPPDSFFLTEDNGVVTISLATFFKDPGVYDIQVGTEYQLDDRYDIVWTEPSIRVFVVKDYTLWSQLSDDTYELTTSCNLQRTGEGPEYQCDDIY